MIKLIEDNKVFEVLTLMNKYAQDNAELNYNYTEAVWIKFLLHILEKQNIHKDPHYLAIGDYDKGKLKGFLLANTFADHYNNNYIMDVKDCVVDIDNKNNSYVIFRLYDYLIEHTKKHGGKYWRADSIRNEKEAIRYARFLQKRYNAVMNISIRGTV